MAENKEDKTSLDIAEEKKFDDCTELVRKKNITSTLSLPTSLIPPFILLFQALLHLFFFSQLQDASRKKFGKCEHIDIDWGVNNGDCENESIYQTPVDLGHNGNGGMRRSETADNIMGGGVGNTSTEKHLGIPLIASGLFVCVYVVFVKLASQNFFENLCK